MSCYRTNSPHADTHVGPDIDDQGWQKDAFPRTDARIKEGLTQHYTETICARRLRDRFPAAREAFRNLLDHQSGAYVRGPPQLDKNVIRAGESVRLASVRTRRARSDRCCERRLIRIGPQTAQLETGESTKEPKP